MSLPRLVEGQVRVIGNRWSPRVHELKAFLARSRVPYRWRDIDSDPEALDVVRRAVPGVERFPVVLFPDGSALVEPDVRMLAERLGLDTVPDDRFCDLIVGGGGPAGLSASIQAASEGLRLRAPESLFARTGVFDHAIRPPVRVLPHEQGGRLMNVPYVYPTSSALSGEHTGEPHGDAFDRLVGTSPGMRAAAQRARIVAQVDAPLLLQGETGVGKDAFARAIHESSRHRDGPFVALNCGGLPRDLLASELFGYVDGAFTGARRTGQIGKIEAADGGTLLLDEIGEMPLDLQPYFLRVLEDGEIYPVGCATPRRIQFRLVAACNSDLRADMGSGRFRRDLFYRVAVTTLHIPPLRERAADIPSLVEHFADDLVRRDGLPRKRFAASVLSALAGHSWPGNLRELRNVVESMMLFAEDDVIGLDSLPIELPASTRTQPEPAVEATLSTGLEAVERDAIHGAIRSHRGNLSRTAHDLHISKSTLYLKMKKYALEPVLREVRRARH